MLRPFFTLVLAGCPFGSPSCPDTHPAEARDTVELDPAALGRYAGDDGILSDAECDSACAAESYIEGAACTSHAETAEGGAELVCTGEVLCE